MRIIVAIFLLVLFAINVNAQWNSKKRAAVKTIDNHFEELTGLSDEIWSYAELAFEESKSAKALSDFAESKGFKVERGVGKIPTAFTATYGSGSPVIGILGEFDALPGLSQKTLPTKNPVEEGEPGHGCGHNLFGVASFGAAFAIKELMEAGKIKGTVIFYGTPAEEKYFAKVFMAREGVFDGLDVIMDWHPADEIETDVQSSLALVDFKVEFEGQAAHASADPWNGRSASDALEIYTNGINYYREHVKPTVRIHYHIMDAGKVVNVVPDYSKLWVRVRDTKREGMNIVYERIKEMAQGAAIMADVDYKISLISGIHEILPNRTGGAKMQSNIELLGDIIYTKSETIFGKGIQEATGKPLVGMDGTVKPMKETQEHPMGGSTDSGDVSWIVPMIRMGAPTAPKNTPWHSWAVVACGGMSIGHKGLGYAAKALSMTMIDLYENPKLVKAVKAEYKERKGDAKYIPIVPDAPAPIPAYMFDQDSGNND
ncbi:MAG: amidohydrolase [Saprospiraceae bacterium]